MIVLWYNFVIRQKTFVHCSKFAKWYVFIALRRISVSFFLALAWDIYYTVVCSVLERNSTFNFFKLWQHLLIPRDTLWNLFTFATLVLLSCWKMWTEIINLFIFIKLNIYVYCSRYSIIYSKLIIVYTVNKYPNLFFHRLNVKQSTNITLLTGILQR